MRASSPEPADSPLQLSFDWAHEARGPAPFVKWPGGKRRLLSQLLPLLPADGFGRYIEPFVGGGAMFFALCPERAVLADENPALVAAYRAVQAELATLVDELRRHAALHSAEYYYATRTRFNARREPSVLTASQLLYLNRTCFNGLYRENRRGEFNVPMGRYEKPTICDIAALRSAQTPLRRAALRTESFEHVLAYARRGDFVFFDPPYEPTSRTASFTAYRGGGFNEDRQDQLRDVFAMLDRRGCKVMLTNSDTPRNRERYARFHIAEVLAPRTINSRADGRGSVKEIVVRNYV